MSEFRTETDSLGDVQVPADALWGAQTQRAVENFPVSGQPMPRRSLPLLRRSSGQPQKPTPAWVCSITISGMPLPRPVRIL